MHQDDVRASLEDLAIRWETPRGRELKAQILRDAKESGGAGIARILKDFIYVVEVPDGRDLRCITLDGEDLSGAVFYKTDLSWASLAGCNLQRGDFKEAILKRANLSQADLSLAHLEEADCSRADFSRCTMDGAHFRRAKMTGAVFEEAVATRASFDGASLSKANFHGAKLDQANFHGADLSQGNVDSGALDGAAARPAKDRGMLAGLPREEFERKVGLHAITSRSTKRFRGLDAIRQAAALLEAAKGGGGSTADSGKKKSGPIPFFGAAVLGTRRFKPGSAEEAANVGEAVPAGSEPPSAGPPEVDASEFADEAGATLDDDQLRATRAMPGSPTDRVARSQRPTMRAGGPVPTPAGMRRPVPARGMTGPLRRVGPPARATAAHPRRPGPPRPAPAPAASLPVAPFDPSAPDATSDWAKAIGQLMQLKGAITKIAIELKDRSQVIYKAPDDSGGYS